MTNAVYLRTEELWWWVFVGIVWGHVDESVNVVFGDSFGNSLGSLDMDVLKREVSANPVQNWARRLKMNWNTLSDSPAQQDYRLCQSDERSLRARACSLDRIPIEAKFRTITCTPPPVVKVLTMNMTLPRSPVSFKCRFAMASRKGTITVHPFWAT